MRYSTRNHNPRQQSSVNSRLDFDATQAAANLIASQRTDAAPAAQRRADAGGVIPPEKLDYLADVSSLNCLQAVDSSPVGGGRRLQRRADAGGVCVRIDGELGRLSVYRHEFSEYRFWNYGIKFSDGSGKIERVSFRKSLASIGIATNRRTFDSILARGNGLYWHERGEYIYLTGWRKLSKRLTKWAAKNNLNAVETNLPGQRRVWVDLSGSIQQGHAAIYNAWISVKAQKNGFIDISRFTLAALWGRSKAALLKWERIAGIRTEARYAEHHDIHSHMIPAHANLYLDTSGAEFASWQLSNRIYPAATDITSARGQGRKVRSACNHVFDTLVPADLKHGGQLRVERTGRINFEDRNGKNGFVSAHKQIDRHLGKHGDIFERLHYAYLTTRYGKHIYEYVFDGSQQRFAFSERDRAGERGIEFERRRLQYRQGWAMRIGV